MLHSHEVVDCKDCVYSENNYAIYVCWNLYNRASYSSDPPRVKEYHYCSYGKERIDKDEDDT